MSVKTASKHIFIFFKVEFLCNTHHDHIMSTYALKKNLVLLVGILVKNGQIRIFWLNLL